MLGTIMDPAVYARAHGVQSEASKVTVTRVACNELIYRRTVDTYRRDMQSKLTSLRREQRRLKRSVRDYRRKLRESEKAHKKDNDKTSKMQRQEESGTEDVSLPDKLEMFPSNPKNHDEKDELALHDPGISLFGWDLKPLHDDWREQSTGLMNDSETVEEGDSQKEAEIEENKLKVHIDETVGRKARKGSGKIGTSSNMKRVSVNDDEEETYSLLSDSSEDEKPGQEDEVIEVVSFRNGRLVKVAPPMVRTRSSVYMKPVVSTDSVPEASTDEVVDEEADAASACPLSKENDRVFDETNPQDDAINIEKAHTIKKVPSKVPEVIHLPHSEQQALKNEPKHEQDKTITHIESHANNQNPPEIRIKKPKVKNKAKISFGDLIKFRHGSNTKKLFSLVDQLAEESGIDTKSKKAKPMSYSNDPREHAAMIRKAKTAQAHEEAGVPGITTYGSVFYTMKFGYASDTEDLVDSHIHDEHMSSMLAPYYSQETSTYRSRNSSFREMDSITEDDRQDIVPSATNQSSIRPSYSTRSRLSEKDSMDHQDPLAAIFPSLRLGGSRTLTQSKANLSEPAGHASYVSTAHSTSMDIASAIDIVSQNNKPHHDMVSTELQRQRRKSSLLEASEFVSRVRHRNGVVGDRLRRPSINPYAKREQELFQKRSSSIKTEHTSKTSDDNVVPWSSAFSRIKMVHTLVDLSHIMP